MIENEGVTMHNSYQCMKAKEVEARIGFFLKY